MIVIAAVHQIYIMLPHSPILVALMAFIGGFIVFRVLARVWDLVGI